MAQRVKHLPAMRETRVRSLGQEDPLEKEMATHSSILDWKIPWTEKYGKLTVHGVTKSWTRLSDFTSLEANRTNKLVEPSFKLLRKRISSFFAIFSLEACNHENVLQLPWDHEKRAYREECSSWKNKETGPCHMFVPWSSSAWSQLPLDF